ncbi:Ig-like domain-containing protein [Rhodococcus marinonascens]|uniref:Ig-like domain-containing protein n=1 Tax=Rhodococcus marinonascens TaxID=38311 RepID=UPI00147303A1|nr:Ig-like domain-containing protein [Rhodococcus marinonascens]
MTTTISAPGSMKRLTTAFGGAILALFLAMFGALVAPAAAHAEVNDLEYSADEVTWGDTSEIPGYEGTLVPGEEITSTFYARNTTERGGVLQVYLGNWTTSPEMEAYVRVEIDDESGPRVDLTTVEEAMPGTELNAIRVEPGQTATVSLVVGMPIEASNGSQDGSVTPNFSLDFEVDGALETTTTVTAPNTADTDEAVNLSAEVKGPEGDAVGGTVQFKADGNDIGAPVALVDGKATLDYTFTDAGDYSITVHYSGAGDFNGSVSDSETVSVTDPDNSGDGSSSGSLESIFGS